MNRNVESHFAQLPSAEIQRSTFDRSSGYKTSFNAGQLIPFYLDEVLPGDTFDVSTSKIVRSQTLLTPLMDNMYLDTYYFFVPNRLCWDHWKEFCGENTLSAWAPATKYQMPVVAGTPLQGTIADYMGLPVGCEFKTSDSLAPSALPFRAYALICNEFFRDENLTDPLNIPTGDANQAFPGAAADDPVNDIANGGMPFVVAKYHDYFTSALPAPQKGDPVGVPIEIPSFSGGMFPVIGADTANLPSYTAEMAAHEYTDHKLYATGWYASGVDSNSPTGWLGGSDPMPYRDLAANTILPYEGVLGMESASATPRVILTQTSTNANNTGPGMLTPENLFAAIPAQAGAGASTNINFTVNELRLAFAMQRYLESLARSGSRYTELLLGLFGVRSPDARLQRPEYLGGNRVPINVSEVTNTAQAELDFLGDLGAKSMTADNNHDFIKSFTEHGYVLGLMCVRYDHSYSQGIARHWTRKSFEDFYNPKFAHLGEVPIYQAEIYAEPSNLGADGSTPTVFGYQEIWAEYRYKPSMVTSEMRPGAVNSLAHWNLSDFYDQAPTLSDGWIRETTANVDRALAVTSKVANQFFADVYVANKCTRPMPMYSVPGLIDHF